MAKIKYKIPTSQGIVTRTSAREYTHVVVGGKLRESVCRKFHAKTVQNAKETLLRYRQEVASGYKDTIAHTVRLIGLFGGPKYDPQNKDHVAQVEKSVAEAKVNFAKWIADLEKTVANDEADLAEWIANRKPIGLIGFAGRRDLAEKLAGYNGSEYEDVEIVEITPEMKTEVKSKMKKERAPGPANLW